MTRSIPWLLTAAAMAAISMPASAQDLPKRKSGLWEIRPDTLPANMVMAQCIDEASDTAQQAFAGALQDAKCSKSTTRREASDRIVTDSVCQAEGSTMTTRAVASGDFATKYVVDVTSSYEPPLRGKREHKQRIEARWTGPCRAGMKPGDIVMPGGQVVPAHFARKMQDMMLKK